MSTDWTYGVTHGVSSYYRTPALGPAPRIDAGPGAQGRHPSAKDDRNSARIRPQRRLKIVLGSNSGRTLALSGRASGLDLKRISRKQCVFPFRSR